MGPIGRCTAMKGIHHPHALFHTRKGRRRFESHRYASRQNNGFGLNAPFRRIHASVIDRRHRAMFINTGAIPCSIARQLLSIGKG